jgi:hypothetical protein
MFNLGSNMFDCSKDDDITIEPRLLEYIRKKKYYSDNNINTESLDRDYSITQNDMLKIRGFLRGDKNVYNMVKQQDFIDTTQSMFPSEKLKKDPRFGRLKQKQQKDSDALNYKNNYGTISRTYDMYRKDRPFASAMGNDFSKSDFHPNQWLNDSKEEKIMNPNVANFDNNSNSLSMNNTYVHPRSKNNGYLGENVRIENDRKTVDDMIGKLTNYKNKVDNKGYMSKFMDTDKFRETEVNYIPMPLMNGSSMADVDVDTYVRYGTTPSRGGKSLGYPNPIEHYFDYVSNDHQLPQHTVSNRGMPSRAYNKESFMSSQSRII